MSGIRRLLLAAGASTGITFPAEDETMYGVRAKYYTGAVPLSQSVPNVTFYAVRYNYTGPLQRCFDTHGFHPINTESNLTGTVAKANGSTTITGTGTSFLSQLQVGYPVRIAGGGETIVAETFVVVSITDNTHFEASYPAAKTASGITAVLDSSSFVIQAGSAGYYAGNINAGWRFDADGIREINVAYNNPERGVSGLGSNSNLDEQLFAPATPSGEQQAGLGWGPVYLDEYDFVQAVVYQSSGGSLDMAADLPGMPFAMWRVGV